jgi:hypothetical protein
LEYSGYVLKNRKPSTKTLQIANRKKRNKFSVATALGSSLHFFLNCISTRNETRDDSVIK